MKDLLRDAVWAVAVVLVVLIMSGCRTMASLGDLVSSAGQDLKSVAQSSEQAVKGYGDGL